MTVYRLYVYETSPLVVLNSFVDLNFTGLRVESAYCRKLRQFFTDYTLFVGSI